MRHGECGGEHRRPVRFSRAKQRDAKMGEQGRPPPCLVHERGPHGAVALASLYSKGKDAVEGCAMQEAAAAALLLCAPSVSPACLCTHLQDGPTLRRALHHAGGEPFYKDRPVLSLVQV